MTKVFTAIFVLGLMGCGDYDRQVTEKEKNEKLNAKNEERAEKAERQVKVLKTMFSHVYVSTNYLWIMLNKQSLEASCEDIGYAVPSDEMKEEYKTEVEPRLKLGKVDQELLQEMEDFIQLCAHKRR